MASTAIPRRLQDRKLLVASDHRRVLPAHIAVVPLRGEQTVGGHRLRLALQSQRLDWFNFDGVAHEPVRHLADVDLIRWRGLLEPRSHVDRISSRELLIGRGIVDRDDLAGVHAGAVREHNAEASAQQLI